MLVKFTDMDNDAILVDPLTINVVTEAYMYDDRGLRVKKGSRHVHLESSRIEVQEEIGEIFVMVNNACD